MHMDYVFFFVIYCFINIAATLTYLICFLSHYLICIFRKSACGLVLKISTYAKNKKVKHLISTLRHTHDIHIKYNKHKHRRSESSCVFFIRGTNTLGGHFCSPSLCPCDFLPLSKHGCVTRGDLVALATFERECGRFVRLSLWRRDKLVTLRSVTPAFAVKTAGTKSSRRRLEGDAAISQIKDAATRREIHSSSNVP